MVETRRFRGAIACEHPLGIDVGSLTATIIATLLNTLFGLLE
jgi:hypothetical protein